MVVVVLRGVGLDELGWLVLVWRVCGLVGGEKGGDLWGLRFV